MPFRDDFESLRARIENLESELAAVKEENARLKKGQLPKRVDPVASQPHWLFGVPTKVVVRKDLAGTPTALGIREVRHTLEKLYGHDGRFMSFDNDLWFKAGAMDFTMTPGDGSTRLELQSNHGWLSVPIWTFMAVVAYVAFIVLSAKLEDPALAFAASVPIAAVLAGLLARIWGRRYLRGLEKKAFANFEALGGAISEHLDTSSRRVRVDVKPSEEEAPASSAREPEKKQA